jgi:hypothetical protein
MVGIEIMDQAPLGWTREASRSFNRFMRLAGLLLLPAGWGLVIAAVILLAAAGPRTAFVLAGLGVEMLGLVLLTRSHVPPRRRREDRF